MISRTSATLLGFQRCPPLGVDTKTFLPGVRLFNLNVFFIFISNFLTICSPCHSLEMKPHWIEMTMLSTITEWCTAALRAHHLLDVTEYTGKSLADPHTLVSYTYSEYSAVSKGTHVYDYPNKTSRENIVFHSEQRLRSREAERKFVSNWPPELPHWVGDAVSFIRVAFPRNCDYASLVYGNVPRLFALLMFFSGWTSQPDFTVADITEVLLPSLAGSRDRIDARAARWSSLWQSTSRTRSPKRANFSTVSTKKII